MDKIIRDGKVAVLVSYGFGAGWSTWNTELPELVFDSDVVNWVENGIPEGVDVKEFLMQKYDKEYVCVLGLSDLEIVWLPEGTAFEITEYDGAEGIKIKEEQNWIIA